MGRLLLPTICLTCFLSAASAAEPELLPPPRTVSDVLPPPALVVEPVPLGPMGPILPGYILPDRYAHWQLVLPDQYGFPKPRVILAPQPFYLYNGMPYRFLPTRPRDMSTFPVPR